MTKTGILVVIQSHVDGINRLVENQNISAHLEKHVMDTMHDIMDGLEQLKNNKPVANFYSTSWIQSLFF